MVTRYSNGVLLVNSHFNWVIVSRKKSPAVVASSAKCKHVHVQINVFVPAFRKRNLLHH